MCFLLHFFISQEMPVIIAGNHEQKKKYLGRMTEEPLMCVSEAFSYVVYNSTMDISKVYLMWRLISSVMILNLKCLFIFACLCKLMCHLVTLWPHMELIWCVRIDGCKTYWLTKNSVLQPSWLKLYDLDVCVVAVTTVWWWVLRSMNTHSSSEYLKNPGESEIL